MQCNGGLKYYCELGASLSECLGIHLCIHLKCSSQAEVHSSFSSE